MDYFHIFYYGITTTGGKFYSLFLVNNFNYISWITSSILYVAKVIGQILGLHSIIQAPNVIKADSGASVILGFSCLGFSIISLWVAFVFSHENTWKKKLYWCIMGIFLICFINCWRIAILLLALDKNWPTNQYIDHHDMFNLVAYTIVFILIHLYGKNNEAPGFDKTDVKLHVSSL